MGLGRPCEKCQDGINTSFLSGKVEHLGEDLTLAQTAHHPGKLWAEIKPGSVPRNAPVVETRLALPRGGDRVQVTLMPRAGAGPGGWCASSVPTEMPSQCPGEGRGRGEKKRSRGN